MLLSYFGIDCVEKQEFMKCGFFVFIQLSECESRMEDYKIIVNS